MAHGFLSYGKSDIGPSWFEEKLEEKFDQKMKELRGAVKEGIKQGLVRAFSGRFQNTPERTPKPYSWSKGEGLQKMLGGSALQKALPMGSDAINAEVVGNGGEVVKHKNIVNLSKALAPEPSAADAIFDTTAQRVVDDDDVFAKSAEFHGGGGDGVAAIVQAISRLENTTMGIGAAIQQQTQAQRQIAQAQQEQADKMARKSIAAAEASSFTNDDFSSNIAYEQLASGGRGLMRGGFGGMGGGPIGGLGGKVAAKNLAKAVTRRGGARAGTRLGAVLGGRMGAGIAKKIGKRLGGKAIGKIAGKGIAKSLGKKIPLVGLGLGAVFAAQRALQGDFIGAGLELASGAASTVPGVGTAASVGLDAALMAKDMTAMADGGITDGPVNALIGEQGKEGVFPLEGTRGKKTFKMFGEGMLDAQRQRKGLFGKLQAEGMKEYYDKQDGWGRMGAAFGATLTLNTNIFDGFGKTLIEILGAIKLPWGDKLFDFGNNNGDGNGDTNTNSLDYGERGGFLGLGARQSGQDVAVNGDGVFTSQIGGVVTKIGEHKDLGQYVDIVNEEKGVTERIADISGVVSGIEVGSVVAAGDPVAKGNDAGMIHYEIRDGGNVDPAQYEAKFGFKGTQDPDEFLNVSNDTVNSTTNNEVIEANNDGSEVDAVEDTSSDVLNSMSEDVATTGNGTTIINNITNNNMTNGGSSEGSDVALGTSSAELGANALFATLALRA